jgi:RNA polymerase sigma factor (sigma-70 family)
MGSRHPGRGAAASASASEEVDVQHPDVTGRAGVSADEAALVRAARDRDLEAFAELVRQHQGTALRAARAVGAGEAAEDAVQEAFVSAWRALDRFDDARPFRPWLLAIVVNEVRNRQRLWRRRNELLRGAGHRLGPQEPVAGEEAAEQSEQRRLVTQALDRLPEKQRVVVTMRYLLELSEDETATALGCPKGSVKSRLSRGLGRLQSDPAIRGLLGKEDA